MADEEIKTLEDLAEIAGTEEAVEPSEPAAPVYEQKIDSQGRAYATGKALNTNPTMTEEAKKVLFGQGAEVVKS